MSNQSLIIPERPARIGNFLVGRLLPFREKRLVGPFAFIDHMGPADLAVGEKLDIGPHPHIGLSTLTFLFEGAIRHRDSLGSDVIIRPGQVNWMTAGKGVVHSERTPLAIVDQDKRLHGLQIWVALPTAFENIEPSFHHIEANDLPRWEDQGAQWRLIAGTIKGHTSPVPVYSPLYFIEIKADTDVELNLSDTLFGESGLYILEGSIETEGHSFGPKQLLVALDARTCGFAIKAGTTVYVFGGDPFPEERFIYWNFVASGRERIEAAKQLWIQQRLGTIEGETDIIPLPEDLRNR